jgi:hypothetical protein
MTQARHEYQKCALPAADSISAIRKWINPRADLAGFEPLYEGLKLAGVRSLPLARRIPRSRPRQRDLSDVSALGAYA